jgi:hypothetical protein
MKTLRTIPVFAVAAALLFVQPLALRAQVGQVTEAPAKAAKKATTKAKATAEKAAGETGAAASSASKEAVGKTEKAMTQTPAPAKTGKAKSATGSAQRAMPSVSESEITAAKADGKVWVNTQTGVYHKGGRWYGATKQGKFMTEDEAIRSGYRVSKGK